jgi:hypothetical protein
MLTQSQQLGSDLQDTIRFFQKQGYDDLAATMLALIVTLGEVRSK